MLEYDRAVIGVEEFELLAVCIVRMTVGSDDEARRQRQLARVVEDRLHGQFQNVWLGQAATNSKADNYTAPVAALAQLPNRTRKKTRPS